MTLQGHWEGHVKETPLAWALLARWIFADAIIWTHAIGGISKEMLGDSGSDGFLHKSVSKNQEQNIHTFNWGIIGHRQA